MKQIILGALKRIDLGIRKDIREIEAEIAEIESVTVNEAQTVTAEVKAEEQSLLGKIGSAIETGAKDVMDGLHHVLDDIEGKT